MVPEKPLTWREAKIMVDHEINTLRVELKAELAETRTMYFTRYAEIQRELKDIAEKLERIMVNAASSTAANERERDYKHWQGPIIVGAIMGVMNILTVIFIEVWKH
jgi:ribosomal protein L29